MAMNMASRKMAGKKTPAGEGSTAMTGGPMAKKSKIGKAMAAKKMATKKPAKGYQEFNMGFETQKAKGKRPEPGKVSTPGKDKKK